METTETVAKVSEQMGDLPALSTVVAEVLRMTEDPSTSTGDVCEVVQSDPGLTGKVLRVSNSSYYGMRQYVGTLKLALVILGVREVRNIVLGISVFETLTEKKEDLRLVQDIWNASLQRAGLSKQLATQMALGLQGEEFIASLLADIGKMGLLRQFPDHYQPMIEEAEGLDTLLMLERQAFGFDHADVAMALAENWNLPQTLSHALWFQYPNPERKITDAKDPSLAAVTRLSRLACLDDYKSGRNLRSLSDTETWNVLENAKNSIPPEDRKDVIATLVQEIGSAPAIPM